MAKTLSFTDTSPQTVKIGDTTTSFTLICGNDNVATDLTNATSITAKLGNASGYLKSAIVDPASLTDPATGQVTVNFNADLMTSLPAGGYAIEVWVVDSNGTSIYPSDGSTGFTITNNIQSANSSTITTITFDDFVKELNKVASQGIADGSVTGAKIADHSITSVKINPADVKLLSTDNFEFNRSAIYRGFSNYEFLTLENGSIDVNGNDTSDTTTVRTPLSNMISLLNIGILLFAGTKYAYKIVEYKSDNSYSKVFADFTNNSNSVINLNSGFKYRLVIKTTDSSTIDTSDVKLNVKVVNNASKNDYELGALQPYMQERQLVVAGNFRPYFYRTSDTDIAVVFPPRSLYYYFGNGTKYIQLPSTFYNQVFNLPNDSVLIWDLNSNSIVVQKVYAQRNFNSVVLANNLYGNITNGYFEKYWSGQTQNIRGYKQNFQDILSKKDVTGVDNFTSQGMVQVGHELWVGNQSTDDHSTNTIGQIYKFDSGLNKVGRFVHNLGHLNSMDYNSETDSLLTSNTSDDTTIISEIIIVQNVHSLNLPEAWPLIDYSQNYVVKIPLGVNNIGGGPIFGENKNVVYFMAGQYYGTYKIQKYWLGTGSNDVSTGGYGTFIAGKGDNEYNGTAKLLGEFYGPTMEVGQDATYFNGNIYGTFGRRTGKIYKIELNQATTADSQGTYALKEAWVLPNYNSNGGNVSSEAEGTVIWNGQYLRTSFQNKIVDIPLFNRQFGTGSVGNKVYYDFKSGTEKNITITPTSDVTDIYVSSKDDDGFIVTSKSGGNGTFDWSCNL
ncbi:hypothetical protein Ped0620_02600 [Pediococcus pentosaceus]|nr:hypothetical protein [Pediococcus pentosaceus]UQB03060.1 hypothetical protein Ped0620_02600 [Pediococcus pentosaceus]